MKPRSAAPRSTPAANSVFRTATDLPRLRCRPDGAQPLEPLAAALTADAPTVAALTAGALAATRTAAFTWVAALASTAVATGGPVDDERVDPADVRSALVVGRVDHHPH